MLRKLRKTVKNESLRAAWNRQKNVTFRQELSHFGRWHEWELRYEWDMNKRNSRKCQEQNESVTMTLISVKDILSFLWHLCSNNSFHDHLFYDCLKILNSQLTIHNSLWLSSWHCLSQWHQIDLFRSIKNFKLGNN